MAKTNPGSQGPQPLLALAAFAGAALIGGLSWYAYKITTAPPAMAPPPTVARVQAPLAPAAPVTPQVPYNELVVVREPKAAPPIDLPTADGKRFSLAAARGQVVFVNFWATWCPPCGKEMPSMVALGQKLARKYPGKFKMVAVSVDDVPDAVPKFFAAPPYRGLPKDVVVALEPQGVQVTRAYYCQGRGACGPDDVKFPETYIVDRQGRISAFVVGPIDWAEPDAERYLELLIAG